MKYKVMTWVLMVTLFVSQSSAYAFEPCESYPNVINQSNDMLNSDTHSHSMSNEMSDVMPHDMDEHEMSSQHFQEHDCENNCCEQECSCPKVVCPPALPMELSSLRFFEAHIAVLDGYLFPIPDSFLASSRKPPITG